METVKKRLLSMTYKEIQALCKQNGLRAAGKKLNLIETLSETVRFDESADISMDADVQKEEPDKTNETFLVDTAEPEGDMTNDENMEVGAFTFPYFQFNLDAAPNPPSEPRFPLDESFVAGSLLKETSDVGRSTRSRIPKPNAAKPPAGRFAKSHAANFQKMKNIEEHEKELRERHNKYQRHISPRLNALATPKSQQAVRRFPPPKEPEPGQFKFGAVRPEHIASVQIKTSSTSTTASDRGRVLRQRPQRPAQTDVKQLTMAKSRLPRKKVLLATIPDCSERVEQLATPKSAGPVPVPRERKAYTPKTTPYRYVDTTKMSNAELRAYHAQQKRVEKRLNF